MRIIQKPKYGVDWDQVGKDVLAEGRAEMSRPYTERSSDRVLSLGRDFDFCRLPTTEMRYLQPIAMSSDGTPAIYPQMMYEVERGQLPMAIMRLGQMATESNERPLAIKPVTVRLNNDWLTQRHIIGPEGRGYDRLPRGVDMMCFDTMYINPETRGVFEDDQQSLWMPFRKEKMGIKYQPGVLICPITEQGVKDAHAFLRWCSHQYLELKNQGHEMELQGGLAHMDAGRASRLDIMGV